MASDSTDCSSGYYYTNDGCYRSHWYFWGRWVLLVAIALLIIGTISSCTFVARRRRSSGLNPYYGTGWLAPQNKAPRREAGHSMEMNNGQNRANTESLENPPPAYDPHRLPLYNNATTSTVSNSVHGDNENHQNHSHKHEEYHGENESAQPASIDVASKV